MWAARRCRSTSSWSRASATSERRLWKAVATESCRQWALSARGRSSAAWPHRTAGLIAAADPSLFPPCPTPPSTQVLDALARGHHSVGLPPRLPLLIHPGPQGVPGRLPRPLSQLPCSASRAESEARGCAALGQMPCAAGMCADGARSSRSTASRRCWHVRRRCPQLALNCLPTLLY